MNEYTLISCVGTGMYKKEGGYRETVYQFPDTGKECKTSLFLKAVLETEYRPVKEIILVGTLTSSWDMLIPGSGENTDFWLKIKDECENKEKGLSYESKMELESKLPGWYKNIPFKIVVHSSEIDQKNVEGIFSTYSGIPELLEPDTDILFDISHGFRSMPLLVFQSLQLNSSRIFGRTVELVYGEYINEEKISYVRNLSRYWEYYEISSAIKLFDEKLDGNLLAGKIKPYWESGAKFLSRFSEIVEYNFSLQIPNVLKQLKNSLSDFDKEGKKPQWVINVKDTLADIFDRINVVDNEKYPVSKTIWNYSKILRRKNMITQAVIALWIVIETAVTEKIDPSKIGDYDWLRKTDVLFQGMTGTPYQHMKTIWSRNSKVDYKLRKLENLRNQIAHGGGKDRFGNTAHQANIPRILDHMDDAITEFFKRLD